MAKFRCVVDGIVDCYDVCVIDEGDDDGCVESLNLVKQGKSKEDCPYWRKVLESDEKFDTVEKDVVLCPYCGKEVSYNDEEDIDRLGCDNCCNIMTVSVKVLYTTEKIGDSKLEV